MLGRRRPGAALLFAEIVLLIDTGIGLGWLLGASIRSATPAYRPAKLLLAWLPWDPIRAWGLLLVALAAATLLAIAWGQEQRVHTLLLPLCAFWAWWAGLFAWAALTDPHAGIAAVFFALLAVVAHFRPLATVGLTDRRR